ncbi:unnamed protein product [Dibothriocephalus latus]|uniref:Uncharacterized protein n=1 Tax=Dibothriocephalus latus TaxID=60516 RepID=A0A3P7P3Q4_DIBLA|nr:unnamed protein product [Dibothriocephalus latus]
MITSDRKAMDVSGGFLQLTDELECDVPFQGAQFSGKCYLINRPELGLNGLDWIEKLGLLDMPLNRICNGVHSTSPSLTKSNQLATKLMSAIPLPAEVHKEEKKEKVESGEKAPAASETHQTPGRSTRSGA